MALIKCKECGNEVSSKAEACPKCGVRIKPKSIGCGGLIIALILLGVIVSIIIPSGDNSPNNSPTPVSSPPAVAVAEKIPYQVIAKWSIPNGGYGRVIVINPKYRNEADLVKIGKQLHKDTIQDRNAFVFIFDDKVAALNRKAAIEGRLEKKDLAHYDEHTIGSYIRNINTGYHAITIMLQGVKGPAKKIPLP